MDLAFSPDEERSAPSAAPGSRRTCPGRRCRRGDTRDGFAAHLEWERTLFDARYAVVSWPEEYGGRDASLWEWLIFEEEYYRGRRAAARHAERHLPARADDLRVRHAASSRTASCRKMASGEQTWCQGWSEPNAGSDLAGIQTKAVRDDARGGWRLIGPEDVDDARRVLHAPLRPVPQRPDAERHRGLTYFLVDLATPGVTVRPVERLDGDEGFAEVFLDDVFVADADVLGEPNEGWGVAMATTGSERGLTLRSPGRFLATAQRLIDLYHDARRRSRASRDRLVDACDRRRGVPLADVLDRHPHRRRAAAPGAESSLVKVFWSELDVELHELALELLGRPRRAARRRRSRRG